MDYFKLAVDLTRAHAADLKQKEEVECCSDCGDPANGDTANFMSGWDMDLDLCADCLFEMKRDWGLID
jgi:hypothetical protein